MTIDPNDIDEAARLSDEIVDMVRPLLAGHPPQVQGIVVVELLAIWVAGHDRGVREASLKLQLDALPELVALWDERCRDQSPRGPSRGRESMTSKGKQSFDDAVFELRKLPLNDRAEAIISMFSMVVCEFAAMALEHVEATPATPVRRRQRAQLGKLKRTIKRRQ